MQKNEAIIELREELEKFRVKPRPKGIAIERNTWQRMMVEDEIETIESYGFKFVGIDFEEETAYFDQV